MKNYENTLREIERDFIDFNDLDEIIYDFLPKDIIEIIFEMINPICKYCFECCVVCKIYCYFNCLRETSGVDICNKKELEQEMKRYFRNNNSE